MLLSFGKCRGDSLTWHFKIKQSPNQCAHMISIVDSELFGSTTGRGRPRVHHTIICEDMSQQWRFLVERLHVAARKCGLSDRIWRTSRARSQLQPAEPEHRGHAKLMTSHTGRRTCTVISSECGSSDTASAVSQAFPPLQKRARLITYLGRFPSCVRRLHIHSEAQGWNNICLSARSASAL